MMGSRISVVIPAFNAAAWISTALDAVLNQTHTNLEIVVVDDGSQDATVEKLAAVLDTRLRIVRQSNMGQSAALNRGVAESSGEFIKFLDADDWINPGHLECQLRVLEGRKDCLAACTWGYFVEDPLRIGVRREHADRDYEDPLEWLVDSLTQDEGMMGGWRWLIPREIWDKSGGWDERLSLNNDFDFSIRLLLSASAVRFAGEAIYGYRKGVPGALSGSRGQAAMTSAFRTTESGCQALLAREDSPRIRQICADRWQQWLFQFYPDYPELARLAEEQVVRLGGSTRRLAGGRLLRWLLPFLGWKGVRRLQAAAYRRGWDAVLKRKARRRIATIER